MVEHSISIVYLKMTFFLQFRMDGQCPGHRVYTTGPNHLKRTQPHCGPARTAQDLQAQRDDLKSAGAETTASERELKRTMAKEVEALQKKLKKSETQLAHTLSFLFLL